MSDLVKALLAESPTCPECAAPLPEDARTIADLSDVPQLGSLADRLAEPNRPFSADLPDDHTIDLDPSTDAANTPADTVDIPVRELFESPEDVGDTVDFSDAISTHEPKPATLEELGESTADLPPIPPGMIDNETTEMSDASADKQELEGASGADLGHETVDLTDDVGTSDSTDSTDTDTVDIPGVVASDERAGATIDLGHETVDLLDDNDASDSTDTADIPGVVASDDREGATIDLDSSTVDLPDDDASDSTDTSDIPGVVASDDREGATIDLDSSTVDLTDDNDASDSADTSDIPGVVASDDREGATIDLDSSTVDLEAPDNSEVDSSTSEPASAGAGTVDLHTSTVRSPTVDEAPDATLAERTDADDDELALSVDDQVAGADQQGRQDRSAQPTCQGDEDPPQKTLLDGESSKSKKTSPNADQTVSNKAHPKGKSPTERVGATATDRSSIGGDSSRAVFELPRVWSTIDRRASPRATLRGNDSAPELHRTNLVIQTRELQESSAQSQFENADYELLSQLGEGGMGVVYSARQASIDRKVAIKMLKPQGATDSRQRGKFLSEAVVTGELDHPNIVPIYDLGTNADGSLFYSMKQVEGTPWEDVLADKPLSENLRILMKVADAIAFAHARSVIHRDLKPENIMLGEFGEVLVMDWGLAAPTHDHEVRSAAGTPAYMAPEMAAGPFEQIGICSDIYLLGAILFEVLVGKPPHRGETVMKCLMAAAQNEIRKHDVQGELMDIAMRAMASDPSARFESVQAFQAAIDGYLEHIESIELTSRSAEQLRSAIASGDYQGFARSLFGYREAINLWSDNQRAVDGMQEATMAYAQHAKKKEDYDLAASLLDPKNPQQRRLLESIADAQQERDARQQRLRRAKRVMVGLGAALTLVIVAAFLLVNDQRREAVHQRGIAEKAFADEEVARRAAEEAKRQEERERKAAEAARTVAEMARSAAEMARAEEAQARADAERQQQLAVEAKLAEISAREQEEYEAYIARIGLAQAKIQENAFGQAFHLLQDCPQRLRNWEWGRLMHLCTQGQASLPVGGQVEAIAVHQAPGVRLLAVANRNGEVQIWDLVVHKQIATLEHAGQYVTAVAFSPDGHQVATGSNSRDAYIQLWDWRNGKVDRAWAGHEDAVLSVAYSPDGKQLATASYDETVQLWERDTGRRLRTLRGHTWWVWSARFSHDGKRLVSAGHDGKVFVWDLATGQSGAPFRDHQGPVFAAEFSKDDQWVASAGNDQTVRLWRPADVKPFDFKAGVRDSDSQATPHQVLRGQQAAVRDLRFGEDGRLISCGHDNVLVIWDREAGKPLAKLRGHDSWVRSCWLSDLGDVAYSGSFDGFVKAWDVGGYQEQQVLRSQELTGHDDAILGAAFAPDGNQVVTASRDRTARVWSVDGGALTMTIQQGHSFLTSRGLLLNQGRNLVTAAVDESVRIWDVASGSEMLRLENTGRGAVLALSHDEHWLLTGGDGHQAQLWSVPQLLAAASAKPDATKAPRAQPHSTFPAKAAITAAAISQDHAWVALGDASGRLTTWSLDGERRFELRGHTRRIVELRFLGDEASGDAPQLLAASADNTVSWWDAATGTEFRDRLLRHPSAVVSLDAGGNRIATCDAAGAVRIWSAETGELEGAPTPTELATTGASLSDDGRLLIRYSADDQTIAWTDLDSGESHELSTSARGQVVWSADVVRDGQQLLVVGGNGASLWDLDSGAQQAAFRPHGAVASGCFSPDSQFLATSSWDQTAKIWSVNSGKAVQTLGGDAGHTGYVNAAAYSPDGQHIVTAADDKTAIIWNAATGKPRLTLQGHRGRVTSAQFGESMILTSSGDGEARLWDPDNGEVLAVMRHVYGLRAACLSRDQQWVATAGEDSVGRLWQIRREAGALSAELVRELSGHTAAVQAIALSPDGSRVITGSADFSAKLWDASTGKEILTLQGHDREVTAVAFSADGRRVLTASRDGTAILWPAAAWSPSATEQAP